jgi:ribosomal protein S18 acetylase RimI-like enzyme
LSSYAIRRAGPADIPAVLELWRVAETVPTVTDSASALRTLIAHDPDALLVAESGGQLVGSVIIAWDGWRGSFYRLAVRCGQRRSGMATALIREGEARLRSRGARRLQAIVAGDQTAALRFWEAVGFERQPDRVRFVRNFTVSD